jgi:Zn-finger nucleic acid-binding protein
MKCPKCKRELEMEEYVKEGGNFYYCEGCKKVWGKNEV